MSIFMWLAYALCFIGMVVCGVGAAATPRTERAKAERTQESVLDETMLTKQAQSEDTKELPKKDVSPPGPIAPETTTPAVDAVVDSPKSKTKTDDVLFSGAAAHAAAMATFGENIHQNARFRVRFV